MITISTTYVNVRKELIDSLSNIRISSLFEFIFVAKLQQYCNAVIVYVGAYFPLLPIRLVNGSNQHNGRVEIYTNSTGGLFNARWGTVCDDEWDFHDARVVCRQLGYPDAVAALRSSQYGEGTLPIILSNVSCAGHESNLTTCKHNGIGVHDCLHSKIAAVECLGMFNVIKLYHAVIY